MNKDFAQLRKKKVFVFDMDGTFYLGKQLIPGALDCLHNLQALQKKALFFTNNSSQNAEFYQKKVRQMGLAAGEVLVYTSGDVLTFYLEKNHPGARVYLVGTDSLAQTLLARGVILAEQDVDVVAVGFDTSLEYRKVEKACTLLRRGAVFLATNPDLNCPVENGFMPDCGSICAMLTASTGKEPVYLGKPYLTTLEFLVQKTGYQPAEMVVVGDRLYTDIAFGQKAGLTSVLVYSGETSPADLEKEQNKCFQPDYAFPSLLELGKIF